MKDPLTKLAIKYDSDRHPESKHSYTPFYYSLFETKRRSTKKVLEIGVGEGAGLRMWRDFFPNAKIYGADYRESALIKEDRIESILCDQRKREHLVNLIKKTDSNIDLVIEDASHRSRDQIYTCSVLMPQLNKNVTYVIENVFDLNIIKKLAGYEVTVPRLESLGKRYDDWLVVVRHGKKV